MAVFDYKAIDRQGKQHRGVIETDGARQARQHLKEQGLMPLSVEITHSVNTAEQKSYKTDRSKLGAMALAILTRQMAVLLRSGMPLESALEAVSKQAVSANVRRIMSVVRGRVREGYSLSDSMGLFPNAFSRLYRSIVAAGEHSASLDAVLERLADYSESERTFRQKTISSLIYPILLTIMSIAVVLGLMTYVVPDVIQVFSDTGQPLPFLTKALLAASDFLQEWIFVLVILFAILVSGFLLSMKIPKMRRQIHRFYLCIPLFCWFTRGINAERFIHTLAILANSGIPLHEGLKIALEVVENDYFRDQLGNVANRVREGESLNASLADMGYFPPLMVHMIASGEVSGDLDSMLLRSAEQQRQDLNVIVSISVSLIEPLIMVVMGVVVLIIVLAILLPIMNMNQLIS